MNSRDLRTLHEKYLDNTYYTADVEWKGVRVRNVGVRSRGNSSRNDNKMALRVDADRYVTGQRFLGLKSFVLKNLWNDASMLRERLSMTMFSRLGQPAPRHSYCRLYINNEFQGLYIILESVDNQFLSATSARTTATSTRTNCRASGGANTSATSSRRTRTASRRRTTRKKPMRCSTFRSTTGCGRSITPTMESGAIAWRSMSTSRNS